MNLALIYDTETTGLPDFKALSEAPHQPHIVQLAACMVDLDTRQTISSMDVICRPDGWTIPDDIAAIHGITTELAMDVGIPESLAVGMFMEMWSGRLRIAHNEPFDARILRIALMRFEDEQTADKWKAGTSDCTAMLSKPILNLPPTERMKATNFKVKTPTLGEAYRHFTGKELENAHSAMADVRGCMEVFFAIKGAAA